MSGPQPMPNSTEFYLMWNVKPDIEGGLFQINSIYYNYVNSVYRQVVAAPVDVLPSGREGSWRGGRTCGESESSSSFSSCVVTRAPVVRWAPAISARGHPRSVPPVPRTATLPAPCAAVPPHGMHRFNCCTQNPSVAKF